MFFSKLFLFIIYLYFILKRRKTAEIIFRQFFRDFQQSRILHKMVILIRSGIAGRSTGSMDLRILLLG